MMRRVPYVKIVNKSIYYLCPKCGSILPRDLYVIQDWCPVCDHPLNRTSSGMMKFYKLVDKQFYEIFIDNIKKGKI
jgi:uncharacterized CHY-type Zn-finger protein